MKLCSKLAVMKNFKALIHMHRCQPDLCSKMLNDYLQAFISKLEAAKQTQAMLSLREDISAREKTSVTIAIQDMIIDLDDAVKVNYQKLKEVLVPIEGLEKEED